MRLPCEYGYWGGLMCRLLCQSVACVGEAVPGLLRQGHLSSIWYNRSPDHRWQCCCATLYRLQSSTYWTGVGLQVVCVRQTIASELKLELSLAKSAQLCPAAARAAPLKPATLRLRRLPGLLLRSHITRSSLGTPAWVSAAGGPAAGRTRAAAREARDWRECRATEGRYAGARPNCRICSRLSVLLKADALKGVLSLRRRPRRRSCWSCCLHSRPLAPCPALTPPLRMPRR